MELLIVSLTLLYFFNAMVVLCCNNLILSVFALVFTFSFGILIFLFPLAEYITVIFSIVYLGAIVVTSSSVTMLSDIRTLDFHANRYNVCVAIVCFIFSCISFIFFSSNLYLLFNDLLLRQETYLMYNFDFYTSLTNLEKIGYCLFNEFGFLLIISGVTMMVAISGCLLILTKNQ